MYADYRLSNKCGLGREGGGQGSVVDLETELLCSYLQLLFEGVGAAEGFDEGGVGVVIHYFSLATLHPATTCMLLCSFLVAQHHGTGRTRRKAKQVSATNRKLHKCN